MAETPSSMIPLGTKAPYFKLFDTHSGKYISLDDVKSEVATVVMFLCNHCPYVRHIHDYLIAFVEAYQAKNVSFIAICSNDAKAYPADSPEKMHELSEKAHYTFPYLYDETQEVAKAYHAACTPDFFVFDKNLHCVYRGRFDDATPGSSRKPSGADLGAALDQILTGQPVDSQQLPSIGCNIKWKKNSKVC